MADPDVEEGVAPYFLDDFKEYVDTQLNHRCPLVSGEDILWGWVFWSREDDQSEHPPNILDLKKKIKDVLRRCLLHRSERPILYQFWAPTMTMDGRSYLTTQNQPFALSTYTNSDDLARSTYTRIYDLEGPVKRLCGYRMISMDYKFYKDRESSDEQLGVPGRVFNHGFPEFSPNVEYYSIKEHPLRDHALRCQLKLSWAIPLFDPSTHLCVGVLEIVSTAPSEEFLLDCHVHLRDLHNYLEEVGLKSSISYVDHHMDSFLNVNKRQALDEIREVLEVVCEVHGLDLAQVWAPCRVGWKCRALVKGNSCHLLLRHVKCRELFGIPNVEHHLRKRQGVIGRAFYSPNVLLCKDVNQLSIIDYPLAHYARDAKLGGCFAICLQSSCTRNDTYVLECFMPPSNKDCSGNQHTALRKILETLKKNFRTFKLASGEELGGHLCIEEIPFQNVSRSTLKRVCRGYGFPRWPPRKKNMVGQSQPSESSRGVDHQQISQLSFDLPFNQASATVIHANPHNITIEDANIVTMRAKYINDITIKFRLALSSGLVELQQQIAKRLHLEAGSYSVKYKDEEDHAILIACDDDLQDCISTYRLLGTSIVVLIDPK